MKSIILSLALILFGNAVIAQKFIYLCKQISNTKLTEEPMLQINVDSLEFYVTAEAVKKTFRKSVFKKQCREKNIKSFVKSSPMLILKEILTTCPDQIKSINGIPKDCSFCVYLVEDSLCCYSFEIWSKSTVSQYRLDFQTCTSTCNCRRFL